MADDDGHRPHVLIIVQNMPLPLDRRVWLECQSLAAAGYRVSAVCPKGPGDSAHEVRDGVTIRKYRPAPAASGPLGYAFEFAYCWIRTALLVARIQRRHPIDAIQACNPPDTYWLLARLLRRRGVRFVFDHHDLCPELYRSKGGRTSPRLLRLLEWLERRTYETADLVLTTNDSYRAVACRRTGTPPDEVTVVRSGPDPAKMRRGAAVPELRNGRQHLVCYLGLMGPQDGVDVVVRTADRVVHHLGRDDVQFALLGYGDCLDDLRALATDLHLDDHVTFTGRVDLAAITDWFSTADVGLSPDPKTPFNDVSTMNKTLEYMAYELPTVAFDLTETTVSAGPAGVYVTATGDSAADIDGFATALVELLDDPVRRAAMGRVGRARIEDGLGWPASGARYVQSYDDLLGRSAPAPRGRRHARSRRPAGAHLR